MQDTWQIVDLGLTIEIAIDLQLRLILSVISLDVQLFKQILWWNLLIWILRLPELLECILILIFSFSIILRIVESFLETLQDLVDLLILI